MIRPVFEFARVNPPQPTRSHYDVVIVGAALSGAGTAILLLQQQPGLRVLLIEKSNAFTRQTATHLC